MKKITVFLHLLLTSSYLFAQYVDSITFRKDQVQRDLKIWGKTYLDIPKYTLTELMEKEHVPGVSIAVINNFQIEWTEGYGWADKRQQKPMTSATIFLAASMSKSVNAFAFTKINIPAAS